MSGYTSGNKAPTLMAQSPNRKGNISKRTPSHSGGVTAMTNPMGSTAYSSNHQGAASAGGNIATRGQKVQVSRPKDNYCGCNDGYMVGSSYLK